MVKTGRGYDFLRVMPQRTLVLALLGGVVLGGVLYSTVFTLGPLAWAGEKSVAMTGTGEELGSEGTSPLELALGCPLEFTDGDAKTPDINILSCHTQPVTCQATESSLDCGKRALMAGDWETALLAFDRAPDDSGEAIYGRYLSRLFRLYADFNNLFFGKAFGNDYNKFHLTRDLNTPLQAQGLTYIEHYVCLAYQVYFPRGTRYIQEQRSIELETSLIDKDLLEIVEGKHTLRGSDGGPLAIRWVQGDCAAPLYDGVYQGVWDWVDAVLIYQNLFGSPAETKRFDIGLFSSESNTAPCPSGNEICGPYSKPSVDNQEQLPVPRLSADAEWFLDLLFSSSQALFDPGRFVPGEEPVFFWRDTNGNRTVDPSDGFTVQLYKTETGEPLLALEDAVLGAQWTPRPADPPVNPVPARTFIYCPNGKDASDCYLLPGEQALEEPAPPWLQLLGKRQRAFPSPDGTKLVVTQEVDTRLGTQRQLFVTDNGLDQQGHPICSDIDGDCCVTCKVLPQGILFGGGTLGAFGQWIRDPANPKGPARGIFYMHNEHPSAWGFGGEAMGNQFFAIRPDGTGNSNLLKGAPPFAMHYQPRLSPDGSQLLWASTWEPASGRAGTHTLLLADIAEDTNGFHLANVHSVVPVRDHGWYETGSFAENYPSDRRIFFTSTSLSMQSVRIFAATLTPEGVLDQVFKLTHPSELFPEPFVVDYHAAWNELPISLDQGRQIVFTSTAQRAVAADRFDRFLTFPPYLEGVMFGLTIYDVRFLGLGNDLGYEGNIKRWISNIDGTNRRLLFQSASDAGWALLHPQALDGQIFFIQLNQSASVHSHKLVTRMGVIKFPEE